MSAALLNGTDVISVSQLNEEKIEDIMFAAARMKELVEATGGDERLKGKVLANVFFEASTRTSCSFQSAMMRLGGKVMQVNESSSSAKKGETLEDTVSCLACYADVLVLRHPQKGSAALAASAVDIPVLNAGDGVGEHPTQALLDLYTILDELTAPQKQASVAKSLQGLVVVMVGDLKHGRTVHSLAALLGRYGVNLVYVAPESLQMPESVRAAVTDAGGGGGQESSEGLDEELLRRADFLYVTRIQQERFSSPAEYEAVKGVFTITPQVMAKTRASCRLLHPLPRVGEITPECDADPRAAYFRQMRNGMYVRMALLALLLGASDDLQRPMSSSSSSSAAASSSPAKRRKVAAQ